VTSALPLAAAAGIYPLGLAIVVRYLGDPPLLRHAFAYLAGAAAITVGAGAALVVILRVAELPGRQERALSAGLQTVLGATLLLVALWSARRHRPATRRRSRRTTAPSTHADGPAAAREPAPARAAANGPAVGARKIFLVGIATYLPSALYVAALKNLAAANLGSGATVLSLLTCASLVLLMVEIPILLRLLLPRQTGRILAAYNDWMRRHGRDIVVLIAAVGGLYFLATGITTLLA
jgi:hypothetical protein